MKKLLSLLLCIALLAGCAVTYDGPTEYRQVIWQVVTDHYWPDGTHSFTSETAYAYDIYGNPAQMIETVDGEPVRKTVAQYDAGGTLLSQKDYDLTGWFPIRTSYSEFTYDDQGRLTTGIYRSGFEKSTTTYTYDDAANTKTVRYESGISIIYYLDEAGYTIRSEQTDGGQLLTEEFTRRPDGKMLTASFYRDGVLEVCTEYTYDEEGRLLSWTDTRESGSVTTQSREYGDATETVYYSDGSRSIIYYDSEDSENISTQIHYDADGNKTSCAIYIYTRVKVPAGGEEGTT